MRRGEVYWIDFTNAQGGEIRKRRPGVIISNDLPNQYLNRVQVMPFTSVVKKIFPSEVPIQLMGKSSKAKADQIMTVAKERLSKEVLQILTSEEMRLIDHALKIQLGLIDDI